LIKLRNTTLSAIFLKNKISKLFFLSLLFIVLFILNSVAQGYEIKVTIPALKDSTIILGHYFAKQGSLYADDTVKLNKKGAGTFKGASNLPGGMYLIRLPSKKYIDLLLGNNQVFSVNADTTDFLNTVRFNGSPENQLFYDYQKFIVSKSTSVKELNERGKKAVNKPEKDSIKTAIDAINEEVTGHIKKLFADNSKLFFAVWLKSLEEIEVPDAPRDSSGKITDSMFQIRYYRKHYFDNFNFADARLLRTPFYEKKIMYYIEKVVPPLTDTIIFETDLLLNKVLFDKELFRYMLETLLYYYGSSQYIGMDGVFAHLAEKWVLPYATWRDEAYKEKIKKEVAKIKPNIIGKVAPNLRLIEVPADHFQLAKTDTVAKSNPYVGTPLNIHDIKAKFLVIVFWEADCGHCKAAIPLLYDSIYPRLKDKGVKILAVHMIASVEGKRKWIDFINEHQAYDWINAWSPYSYEYLDLYNVSAKPTIYILDENKKIIIKKIGPEKIEEVIKFALEKRL
jgi:hypothetical protein